MIAPFWFRMVQNLKKWLYKGHTSQRLNAFKYFLLVLAQGFLVAYMVTHVSAYKKLYYTFKTLGTTLKLYWDIVIDWGLLHGS